MKFPVFARRSNPAVDRPILRKSRAYVEEQVNRGAAFWVDSCDPRKGIMARDMLHFDLKALPQLESRLEYFPAELPGVYFQQPKTSSQPSFLSIREGWDWADVECPLFACGD